MAAWYFFDFASVSEAVNVVNNTGFFNDIRCHLTHCVRYLVLRLVINSGIRINIFV